MDRRAFLGRLAGGLLAAPLIAEAQPAGKVPHIRTEPNIAAFREALRDLGYIDGQHRH